MNDIAKFRFQQQHATIFELIKELDAEFIQTKFENKWSIFQNIVHMGRYQEVYEMRIHAILTGHEPQFNRYDAEHDPEWEVWQNLSLDNAITRLKLKRRALWDEISILTDEQEKLQGKHPRFGLMTILDWTEFFLLHEAHHLYRIFRIVHENKK